MTPSISELDEQENGSFGLDRRNSSGTLLSPEIDLASGTSKSVSGPDSGEEGGFYMLKKDSQRRATLYKVLTHDASKICEVWMEKIITDRKESVVINRVSFLSLFDPSFLSQLILVPLYTSNSSHLSTLFSL